MNQEETKDTKKFEPINFIFIGMLLLFFAIITIVFFYSTNFVVNNVNKIFSPDESGRSVQALDLSRYSLVEKKLNLPINIPEENTAPKTPTVDQVIKEGVIIPENSLMTEEVIPQVLDKKSITIEVLNGVRKAGVASALSNKLEDSGFSKASIGDSKSIYPITTILIKESKKEYAPLIEEIVKKSYAKAVTKTNEDTSKFDVVIIIGKQ